MRKYFSHMFCTLLVTTLVLSSMPISASGNYFIQHYDWEFKESGFPPAKWSWDLNISMDRLNGYREFSKSKRRNYGYMITTKDETLFKTAERFGNASQKKGYTGQTELSFVLSFVQSLEYTSDKVTTGYDEYPRFPLETLADMGGDCEDSSILFATMVILMGYDAVLLVIPGTLENPGHMGVGVSGEGLSGSYVSHDGKNYYYAETTGLDWKIGDLPPEYETSEMRVVEFTGEQYDPMADDDVASLLEKFIDQYPERFALLVVCIIILIFLIYRLLSRNMAAHRKNRSEDFFQSRTGPQYTPDDFETRSQSDPDSLLTRENPGSFFYDPSNDNVFNRSIENRSQTDQARCPYCSSKLRNTALYDDGWCDRCGSVTEPDSTRISNKLNFHGYEDFDY